MALSDFLTRLNSSLGGSASGFSGLDDSGNADPGFPAFGDPWAQIFGLSHGQSSANGGSADHTTPSDSSANHVGKGLGPEMLLYDDGEMTPLQSAAASGSASSSKTGASAAILAPTLIGSSTGLQFDLIWDASVSSAPAGFVSAVEAAATYYSQMFSNREVINLHVGFGEIDGSSLGSGALSESMSTGYLVNYQTAVSYLKQDASSSSYQTTADASLPTSDPTKGGSFYVSSAEAKALGMISGTQSGVDGYIGVSSAYNFSYNQSSINQAQYDGIGAIEHEMTEVMGRVSSDGSIFGAGVYTPLDLFRYTAKSVRGLAAGPGYFSINGGTTNMGYYNNPKNGGDSGDWLPALVGDSYGDGYRGVKATVSPNDLVEDSVLGYRMTASAIAATKTLGLA